MSKNTHKRDIIKALSWRFFGTIASILLTWFVSGDPMLGLKIGTIDVIVKTALYYGHERLWHKIKL